MAQLAARLARFPRDVRESLAFFTLLPVRAPGVMPDFRASAGAWPAAGFLIALLPAATLYLLREGNVPGLISAAVALGLMALLTGGLHEDGLADTADGFGGGRGRARKLAIMREPQIGSFGALALIFTVLTRVGALALLSIEPGKAALALVGVAVLSRALALWHWTVLLPARDDGLAVSAGRPDGLSLTLGLALGLLALIMLIPAFGAAALFAAILAALAVPAFTLVTRDQIGGHTGDTVGAAQQIAETALFVGLSAAWVPVIILPDVG